MCGTAVSLRRCSRALSALIVLIKNRSGADGVGDWGVGTSRDSDAESQSMCWSIDPYQGGFRSYVSRNETDAFAGLDF